MTHSEKWLVGFLRLTAVVLLSAAFPVVMPTAWMETINDYLGLEPLPATPMIGYLTRSLSALYAGLGACCWYVTGDIERYRPLLQFAVTVTLFFAATLIAVDVLVAMPTVWTVIEAAFLLLWTLALWCLLRRGPERHS